MKLNNKGFTLVEGLLILIILTLIGGIGFYFYDANKVDKNAEQTIQSQKVVKTDQSENTKKYLEIKELGIKFELNEKIKNAYYAKIGEYYYLSVRDFDSNPELSGCSASDQGETLGILAIVDGKVGETNNSIAAETLWTQQELDDSGMKKVGDRYYGFMSGNAPCYDPNGSKGEVNAGIISEFKEAFTDQQNTITKL